MNKYQYYQFIEYGNKYDQLLWLLFYLGTSSSKKYKNMHVFVYIIV
jgi:hypothetical protein